MSLLCQKKCITTIFNIQIVENNLPDTFAEFFMSKTVKIVNETVIDPNVYNGQSKLFCR